MKAVADKMNAHYFEMSFTLSCMLIGLVVGVLFKPQDVPISLISYSAMSSVVGFSVGFILSNLMIWTYKEVRKLMHKNS